VWGLPGPGHSAVALMVEALQPVSQLSGARIRNTERDTETRKKLVAVTLVSHLPP
jgi:hypothetical protein